MAYCELEDLTRYIEEDDLIQLSSLRGDAKIMDEDVVAVLNEMIASADGEIDGYLLSRWPDLRGFDPVPDEINRMSCNIVIYSLFLRRRDVPEDWRKRYEDCIKRLEAAANGKYTLGLDASGNQAEEPVNQHRSDALDTDSDLHEDDPRTPESKLNDLFT